MRAASLGNCPPIGDASRNSASLWPANSPRRAASARLREALFRVLRPIGQSHDLGGGAFRPGKPEILVHADSFSDSVGVSEPDELIVLKSSENTAHGCRAIGSSDHKRMNSDNYRSGLSTWFCASLGGELQNVIEPKRLDVSGPMHPGQVLPHIDGDHRIGQKHQRPIWRPEPLD